MRRVWKYLSIWCSTNSCTHRWFTISTQSQRKRWIKQKRKFKKHHHAITRSDLKRLKRKCLKSRNTSKYILKTFCMKEVKIMVIRCYITLGSEWNDLKNWIPHNESELSGRYSHVLETSARIQKSSKYVKAIEDLVKLNFVPLTISVLHLHTWRE